MDTRWRWGRRLRSPVRRETRVRKLGILHRSPSESIPSIDELVDACILGVRSFVLDDRDCEIAVSQSERSNDDYRTVKGHVAKRLGRLYGLSKYVPLICRKLEDKVCVAAVTVQV